MQSKWPKVHNVTLGRPAITHHGARLTEIIATFKKWFSNKSNSECSHNQAYMHWQHQADFGGGGGALRAEEWFVCISNT